MTMKNDKLNVFIGPHLVGELTYENGRLSFQYSNDWRNYPAAFPLSTMLPLSQAELFSDEITRRFFDNLLPEGAIRSQISKELHVSENNIYGMLKALGGECAGAIMILEDGIDPQAASDKYDLLSNEYLRSLIANRFSKALINSDNRTRLSLAGAQHKLPVFMDSKGMLYLPRKNTNSPSTHIIKPAINSDGQQIEHSVINEAFCMKLAESCGLPVPDTTIMRLPEPVYIIKRYDREINNKHVTRIHQIDFCQAMNTPSELKYQAEGGPTLPACFKLIRKVSSNPTIDVDNMLKWVIYNFLIGNSDAHGKNLSLLIRPIPSGMQLAPFYDLMSTAVYPNVKTELAMKIGGEARPKWIQLRHWERLAEDASVKKEYVTDMVQQMASDISASATQVKHDIATSKAEEQFVNKLLDIIETRASHVLKTFDYGKRPETVVESANNGPEPQ